MLIKRLNANGSNDLITTFRPCTVQEFVGQELNKKVLEKNLSKGTTPHSMLFTGPYGCGKTTAARILALGLNCHSSETSTATPCLTCESCLGILNQSSLDVIEINVGESGGKDAVDKITSNLSFFPLISKNKILIFDEAHKLTAAAQDLLLKKVENGFPNVYFIFCTNHPDKLSDAFLSRSVVMHFGLLSNDLLVSMLKNICDYEGVPYNKEVLEYVADVAKGTPRVAIKLLKSVMDEQSWVLANVKTLLSNQSLDEDDVDVMELGAILLKGKFKEALNVYGKLKNVQEDQVRIALAGFFTRRLTWAKSFEEGDLCSNILDILTVPIFMSGKPAYHIMVNNFYKITKIIRRKV